MIPWHSSAIREPEFAGRFYPGAKTELRSELARLFESAKKSENIKPRAIISPHAGYVFSGQVAASAFNQIPEGAVYKRVFVIASSHQMHWGGASVYTLGDYKTPLGVIKVDLKLAKKLYSENELFAGNQDVHHFEHSLEVQLPFLQFKLRNDFKLVPIILGLSSPSKCRVIAKKLEPYFNPNNLFVISTDFSHYPDYDDAVRVDALSAQAVVSNNPEKLLTALEENKKLKIRNLATSMCGWTSVLTLMHLTRGKSFEYRNIEYMNSGDNELYGEKTRVVGYHAIAVYEQDESGFFITETEKKDLLDIARRALYDSYGLKKSGDDNSKKGGILDSNLGAFVSLYYGDKLKGCIGQFESKKPLWEIVQKMAVSASNDRRFEKPDIDMLEELSIEISVLSSLKKIKSIDEIELGKHGIYIKKGLMSGTFLPQVALKTNWTKEEFLGHCSRNKAGLGWEGWKDAEIFIYEAVVFRDKPGEAD